MHGEVRIVYHADGSATVNGVPVAVEPGRDVRDAAYQAAVELVASSGITDPIPATSVEPDGAAYQVTLYPTRTVLAADAAVAGAAGLAGSAGAGGVGAASALNRVRRAWYRPTLSVSWLAAAACACVLLSVLATVLLRENGPSVVRLSVDTENDPGHSSAARTTGRAIATAPGVMSTASIRALAKKAAAAEPSLSPTPVRPHASTAPVPGIGVQPTTGLPPEPQPSKTVPTPTPTRSPKPTPTPSSAKPVAVTNLTLALVGGDDTDQSIAFVATASTNSTAPVTLTYTYAGSKGRAPVTQTVPLSGHTDYVIADLIPAQPYCGGPVTMTVSTSPTAKPGSVTETTQPGC
ncbi:hypothetical protein [Actinospica sp.]|jgi:hypothetical protein|uniref:hypothetical protein n=1 Tax=Actinospica sp. TaxID=1872142 RepID=UPI002CC13165|nr:hypothetical protein [Actinospica sp.]HWG23471.1 hypothetical protein [Actinospica sp.]